MRVDWQRLRLKMCHIIGRLTGNYSLENRLLLRIREKRQEDMRMMIASIVGIAIGFVLFPILVGEVVLWWLEKHWRELSNPVVGRVVRRRLSKGKEVPATLLLKLLSELEDVDMEPILRR